MKTKILGRILVILIIAGVVMSIIYSFFGSVFRPKTNVQVSIDPSNTFIDAQELEHTEEGALSDLIEEQSTTDPVKEITDSSDETLDETSDISEEEQEIVPEEVEVYEDNSVEGDDASDIDMDLITEDNYEMLVFLSVTNGLFDEYEKLLSESFKESYDSFFDVEPFSKLKDVREIDSLFGNFEDKIVTIVVDGVSYTFEYTVDSAGLLDSIKSK